MTWIITFFIGWIASKLFDSLIGRTRNWITRKRAGPIHSVSCSKEYDDFILSRVNDKDIDPWIELDLYLNGKSVKYYILPAYTYQVFDSRHLLFLDYFISEKEFTTRVENKL